MIHCSHQKAVCTQPRVECVEIVVVAARYRMSSTVMIFLPQQSRRAGSTARASCQNHKYTPSVHRRIHHVHRRATRHHIIAYRSLLPAKQSKLRFRMQRLIQKLQRASVDWKNCRLCNLYCGTFRLDET